MGYPMTGINMDVHINGTQFAHTQKWSMAFENNAGSYIDNGTKARVVGSPGPTKISGSITVGTETGVSPVIPGKIVVLKLYTNTTQFWSIAAALITSAPLEYDPANGNPVAITMNWVDAGGIILDPASVPIDVTIFA